MLKIGVARADITPPVGIRLSGFGKRIQPSLGINDPLYATALVVDLDGTTVALLDCDLLMVRSDFTAELRSKIERQSGIPGGHVMVGYTHTHYGPELPAIDSAKALPRPTIEEVYRDNVINQLAGLITEAKSNVQPARIKFGVGTSDIGVNRRERTADGEIILGVNPSGPIDRAVAVCRIETPAGKPLATLVNFACHPVGQDVQIRKISADFVGCMRRVVQEATGSPCLFWQGATGNINILNSETDYANSCGLGTKLGQEVIRVWNEAEAIATEPLRTSQRILDLPPYRCLSRDHAAAELKKAELRLDAARANPKTTPGLLTWHERDIARLKELYESWTNPALVKPAIKAELQTFRIGDLAWACVPGELFTELGMAIKQHSPFKHTMLIAYVNDWIGYLPTPEAFAEGGYEVSQVCYVAPEAMKMISDEIALMFRAMN